MSFHISYVTQSHTFNDEKGEAEILDASDVRRIVDEVTNSLLDEIRRKIEAQSGQMAQMEKSLADARGQMAFADKRLGILNQQFAALPDDQRLLDSVRNAVHEEFAPLLGPIEMNLNAILEGNKNLREDYGKLLADHGKLQEDIAKLHGEVNTLQASVNALNNIFASLAKVWKESNF